MVMTIEASPISGIVITADGQFTPPMVILMERQIELLNHCLYLNQVKGWMDDVLMLRYIDG